jgi:hypothetical protein
VECSGPKPTSLDMAAQEDAEELQKRVYELADDGKSVELKALLKEHPEVDVDEFKDDDNDERALAAACYKGHTECARLLIDHKANVNAKYGTGWTALYEAAVGGYVACVELLVQNGADVNCQTNVGWTPLMFSSYHGQLTVAQYLLEQKADVHARVSEGVSKNKDALYYAMRSEATDRTPGTAFVFLSCNTDAKNVKINDFYGGVTTATRDAHIETYEHVQAYIDEYHRILNLVLSEHVPVDPRFGLGQMGIYQEPLERTLEYLGLSMSKDQVVNTSIDGDAVRRALIPSHLLNAYHWFQQMMKMKKKKARQDELRAQVVMLRSDANNLEAQASDLKARANDLEAELDVGSYEYS